MKVILLADVKGTGKKGQLVNASDGYANNFLLPKKLALAATNENINNLKLQKKAEEKKKAEELAAAKELGVKLAEKDIKVTVKAGENGKVFGSVTNKEIAAAIEAQTGLVVDKKKIVINDPIKMVGTRHVNIKLHPEVTVEVKVIITEG